MINGDTILIAHVGYPTRAFKAPLIYNPWFDSVGINAAVIPMGVTAETFPALFRPLFSLANIRGALVTMPLKIPAAGLVDHLSTTARIAGSCNAILKREDGSLEGDMFDGEGFVRGMRRKGHAIEGRGALVVGAGGVGSAIAASLAAAGVARLALFDAHAAAAEALGARLVGAYPRLGVTTGSRDPAGFDIVVNATPLGMNEGDPLPLDVSRIDPSAFVGEVVMKAQYTPFLAAARARGCATQVGVDMLFEQIPVYLEFFGFPSPTADELRAVAKVSYT